MKISKWKGKKVYCCDECRFCYLEEETAKKCESFCSTHNACSLEIIKNRVTMLK